jgi:hypothetical protein
MIEGWHQNDYLILSENPDEAQRLTEEYGVGHFLPGYTVVGLCGWDDFIVSGANSQLFTVPTVPIKTESLKPFEFNADVSALRPDDRVAGKIKWYIQPIVFGGDPNDGKNLTWISMSEHFKAVSYWNRLYRDLSKSKS